MTKPSWLLIAFAGALALQACDSAKQRDPNAAKTPVPVGGVQAPPKLVTSPSGKVTERDGPFKWNAQALRFEFNGKPVTAGRQWIFTNSPLEFMIGSAATGPADGSGLAVTEIGTDIAMRSAGGLNIDGSKQQFVLVRLTRVREGQLWDGSLYYTTAAHAESEQFKGKAPKETNPKLNETVTLVYDMYKLRRGGADWKNSKIDQIRFDLDDGPGGAFIVHQIAIAERPAGYP